MLQIDFNYLLKKESLVSLLEEHSLYLNKNLGQNFLVNAQTREKLVSFISDENDMIIEIGPGLGHLTVFLLRKTTNLFAIEVDKGFIQILGKVFKDASKATFLHQDVLSLEPSVIEDQIQSAKSPIVVGNLPYNVSTAILTKLLEWDLSIPTFYLLFQKEFVSEKLLFHPTDTGLSQLYCEIQPFYQIKLLCIVSKQNFFPIPHVDSSFISLTLKDAQYDANWKKGYRHFLNLIFVSPKKLLKNKLESAFSKHPVEPIFQKETIDPNARVEHLTITQIKTLFEYFYSTL